MTDEIHAAPSDGSIVRKVLAGDREAFRVLVERHQRRVFLAAWRIVGNRPGAREEAEDLAQETFLKAYAQLARYDERWTFSTWIATIATRTALDAVRSRHTREGAPQNEIVDRLGIAPEDPRSAADRSQWLTRLRTELAGLGDRMRLLIGMHHLDGVPIDRIAGMLGENPSTIKVTLHRARRLLRARLSAEETTAPIKRSEEDSTHEKGA